MSGDSEKLTLQVKDFGPIAEGKVDLRPLTVFIGPSNTGKSYLATLIYALHRFFDSDKDFSLLLSLPSDLKPGDVLSITESDIGRIYEWMLQNSTIDDLNKPLPNDIAEKARRWFHPNEFWDGHFKESMLRCYGVNALDSLVRFPKSLSAEISLKLGFDQESPFEYRFKIDETPTINASIPDLTRLRVGDIPLFRAIFELMNSEEMHTNFYYAIQKKVIEIMYPNIPGSLSDPAHYLPAARTGIIHAHHVVTNAVIQSAAFAGIRPSPQLPTLNGILADFLTTLMLIEKLPKRTGSREETIKLAKSLEKNVLRGSINLKGSPVPNMYPSFVFRPDSWDRDLPLMNTASMISELAPLVLYLRYVVQPGDTLIIEEPEAHLHPEMQAAVIRELAKAVNAGVRIIITTHSEWIVEALQNIVLESKLPEEQRGEASMKPEELGVWTFQHDQERGGSVVRELPFDPEIGFDTEGYSQVAADLHNRWANISSEIERNETR